MRVLNGGRITHSAGNGVGVELAANTLLVDSNSTIDVSWQGSATAPGYVAGGSHGGRGGNYSGGSRATYGDLREPVTLGEAGYGPNRGGGKVHLVAGSLQLEGELLANGRAGASSYNGGGAGGSIWLEAGVLTGSGSIQANGGHYNYRGGGGGGGRIAIYYDEATGFDLTNQVHCVGGDGYDNTGDGAAGTIYLKDNAEALGRVRIDNEGRGNYGNATEIAQELAEPAELVNARVTFQGAVTSAVVNASDCHVLQQVSSAIDDLQTSGGSWGVNAALSLGQLQSVASAWTIGSSVDAVAILATGSTWNQDAAVTADDLHFSGLTWTQNAGATVDDLVVSGVTWTVNAPVNVAAWYAFEDLLLYQNHPDIQLPTADVVVDGWNWHLNVTDAWDRVELLNGAVLTHSSYVATGGVLEAQYVLVDSNSTVDVSVRGNNASGVPAYCGGSHGGRGGSFSGTSAPVYGDVFMPSTLGQGGYGNRNGGGRFKIIADILELDGQILANGQAQATGYQGGGSGGSVWLDVGVLSGAGSIHADGGYAADRGGGGGGGRVAIYYSDDTGFGIQSNANVTVAGADGYLAYDGEAGSLYLENRTNAVRVLQSLPSGPIPSAVDAIQVTFIPAINPATFTASDITITGPGGAVTPGSIVASNNVMYLIQFSPALGEGLYDLEIGPDIENVAGIAMDQDQDGAPGEPVEDVYTDSFEIDLTAPAAPSVSNFSSAPFVNPHKQDAAELIGTRESNTAVFVNGVLEVPAGFTPWTNEVALTQGTNTIRLTATDLAGNRSTTNEIVIFADSVAPVVTGVSPGALTSTSNDTFDVVIDYVEATSGLDQGGSSLAVLLNGVTPVSGTWSSTSTQITFAADAAFVDGDYHVNATLRDQLGNASLPFTSTFTVDTALPAAPTVDPVTTPTAFSNQVVTGTREALTSILLNGVEVAGNSLSTVWSCNVPLNAFSNVLSFTARDGVGNESAPTVVMIYYADPPPEVVSATLPPEGSVGNTDILTGFSVDFSETMDPATVTNPAYYVMQGAGGDALLGNGNDAVYSLAVDYSGSGPVVDFTLTDGPLQPDLYRFLIRTNVEDTVGNGLAAEYVRTFTTVDAAFFALENRTNDQPAGATSLLFTEDPANLHLAGARGSVEDAADTDCWSFASLAGDTFVMAADHPGNPAASRLRYRIQDAAGSNLVADLVTDANGRGQSPAVTIPSNGTYYVCVTEEDAFRGEYRFRALLARPPLHAESEVNDAVGTATPIALAPNGITNAAAAAGLVADPASADFFNLGALTNESTVFLTARLPAGSTVQPVLRVYDQAGVLLPEVNAGSPDDSFAEVRITADGTYHARVSDLPGTGDLLDGYVLDVTVVPTSILVLPNLTVSQIVLPTNSPLLSGQAYSFSYAIENGGVLETPASNWTDRVVLSENAVYGDGDDLLVGAFAHVGALAVGAAYTNTQLLAFPDGVGTAYHLIVEVDVSNEVEEGVYEANNVQVSAGTMTVTRDDYPDLRAEALTVMGTPEVGEELTVQWNTANRGARAVTEAFHEQLVVSNLTLGTRVLLSELSVTSAIPVSGTLARSAAFTPATAGQHVFELTTDSRDELYEFDAVSHASAEVNTTNTTLLVQQFYDITVSADPPPAGIVGGAGHYLAGTAVTVTAEAVTTTLPYFFVNWTQGGVEQSVESLYTFTASAHRALTANFGLPSFTVSAAAQPPGGGVVNGAGSYFYGDTCVLTAAPHGGYGFDRWLESGLDAGATPSITNTVYSNLNFVALFNELNPVHVVTTETDPAGVAAIPGSGTYSNGETAVVFAPASVTNDPTLYTFQHFLRNGSYLTAASAFSNTFTTAEPADITYTAVYATENLRPVVVEAIPSHEDPVPFTTHFNIQIRFDRSMAASPHPVMVVSNIATGAGRTFSTGGVWSTTFAAGDTYASVPFAFTNGMDGLYHVLVSGAQALNGTAMLEDHVLSVEVNATAPDHPLVQEIASNRVSITVGWNGYAAPGDLAFYRVYRETSDFNTLAGLTAIATVGAGLTEYVATDLVVGQPYYVAVTAVDVAGNEKQSVQTLRLVLEDSDFPPGAPTLDPVVSPTTIRKQTIGGTKEPGTNVRLNGTEIVPVSLDATWSYLLTLAPGTNTLVLDSVDAYGFAGPATEGQIVFSDLPPPPVSLSADGTGTGLSVELDWSGYDEQAAGADISLYRVYQAASSFTHVAGATEIGTVPGGTQAVAVDGFARNQTHYFAVVAEDIAGQMESNVTSVAATTTDVVPPSNPASIVFDCTDTNLVVHWIPAADEAGDLAGHMVYVTNNPVGIFVGAGTNLLVLGGLAEATGYDVRVAAVDGDGNESAGLIATGSTWLEHPAGLSVDPYSSVVDLDWDDVSVPGLLSHYAVYRQTAAFTSVTGLAPVVTFTESAGSIGGLANGTTYHFAVVAVNLSGCFDPAVTSVSATPIPDTHGPALANATFEGAPLASNALITTSGLLGIEAADRAGVSRVEFLVDGAPLGSDYNGSDGYAQFLDITAVTDGVHRIRYVAADSLGNTSSATADVVVALAAPGLAPVITSPADGREFTTPYVTLRGSVYGYAEGVQTYLNGVSSAPPVAVQADGSFAVPSLFQEGATTAEVAAVNRGGEGPRSAPVVVFVDSSVPVAPVGVSAEARENGTVRVRWRHPGTPGIKGYHVYRASSPFASPAEAVRVNPYLHTVLSLDDLPPADGEWFYRVVSVNRLGTESQLSSAVSALADGTPPRALLVDFSTTGNAVGSRYAAGTVTVDVHVSEPLQAPPFFSLVRTNGLPISLRLAQVTETLFRGSFDITSAMPVGLAYVNFSARDKVGNRGTEVDAGQTLYIDTVGPVALGISCSPASPIENNATSPVAVTVELALDPADLPAQDPTLHYTLSASQPAPIEVALTSSSPSNWVGTVALTALAGATNEWLSFAYEGVDIVGNLSTSVQGAASFEVYQGLLPAPDPPSGLTATVGKGGAVALTWQRVDEAADYLVYRQAPGEGGLAPYAATGVLPSLADTAPDGTNGYAVAAVRSANAQVVTGAVSAAVQAVADGTAPGAPAITSLDVYGRGIEVQWNAPGGGEVLTYNLYRDVAPIGAVTALVPVASGVAAQRAVDASPLRGTAYYAVTALDALENESAPSASVFTNLSLLPVDTLEVTVSGEDLPQVAWSHPEPGWIDGFNVYLETDAGPLALATMLAPAVTNLTDTGYDGTNRTYTLTAEAAGQESAARSLLLPKLAVSLDTNPAPARGVMNRLRYTVENRSGVPLDNLHIETDLEGHPSVSAPFALPANTALVVTVAAGGFEDLPETASVTSAVVYEPNAGERAILRSTNALSVTAGALVVELQHDEMDRGGQGHVRFALHNTGTEQIDIVMSRAFGPSPEVRLKLTDVDGSVYLVSEVTQFAGSQLVTLPDGTTVSRIEPGAQFVSDELAMAVPATAPVAMVLHLEIDAIHYRYGADEGVILPGLVASKTLYLGDIVVVDEAPGEAPSTVIDLHYAAAVTNVAPALSYGDEDVVISGYAYEKATGNPMPEASVRVVVSVDGFKRAFRVRTDAQGTWSFAFTPGYDEAGHYTVYAAHPLSSTTRIQDSFDIVRVLVGPTRGTLTIPRQYDQVIDVDVLPLGLSLTNLQFVYEAADQPGGVPAAGVLVTTSAPLAFVPDGETVSLTATVRADMSADETGQMVFRVVSGGPAPGDWGTVTVDFTFFTAAVGTATPATPSPVLDWAPGYIETGVAVSNFVSEEVVLLNRGYAPLENTGLALVDTNGAPAPGWAFLNASSNLGTLAVGEEVPVSMMFYPDASVATTTNDPYEFFLRVTADNYPTTGIPVFAFVDASGQGNALFKVMDIYTGTLDASNQVVQGLSGARIQLLRQEGLPFVTNLVSDAVGEVFVEGLPAGLYTVRVSDEGHNPRTDRLWIRPGATTSREYTLQNQLITVEWEVREITIRDRYELVLSATFETDVPAAVVIAEPKSITMPELEPGEVFHGEFTLKNYGLIRADDLSLLLPATVPGYQLELLAQPPSVLEAKQVVQIPYRITRLADATGGDAGGGGNYAVFRACITLWYRYVCSNGQVFEGTEEFCITQLSYREGDPPKPLVVEVFDGDGGYVLPKPKPPGGGGGGWGGLWEVIEDPFVPGGGGGDDEDEEIELDKPEPGPPGDQLDGLICSEKLYCETGDSVCKRCARWVQERWSGSDHVGSSVNLVNGEYVDDAGDLFVQVLGHRVGVSRVHVGGAWQVDVGDDWLDFTYERNASDELELIQIRAGGGTFTPLDDTGDLFVNAVGDLVQVSPTSYLRENVDGDWSEYDLEGRLVRYGDRNDRTVWVLRNGEGQVSGMLDHFGEQCLWVSYSDGRVSQVSDRETGGRTVQYAYDASRNLTNVIDVLGRQTEYAYDAENRMTYKRMPGGRIRHLQYTAEGHVASILDGDGDGMYFEYAYDESTGERYAMVRHVDGRIQEYWYDLAGSLMRADMNGETVEEAGEEDGAEYTYDEFGNPTVIAYPDGTTETFAYRPGTPLRTHYIDGAGAETIHAYDERGNLTNRVEAAGDPEERITDYFFDGLGNCTLAVQRATQSAPAAETWMDYDVYGNLVFVQDPEGQASVMTYDRMGNLLTREDPLGRTWSNTYDAAGHLLTEANPLGQVFSNAYDLAGNRWATFDPEGHAVYFSFDELGRMTAITNAAGGVSEFSYDVDGNITGHVDPNGNIRTFVFDFEGRQVAEVDGNGNETQIAYHGRDRMPDVYTYPTYTRTYGYDARNRLVESIDVLTNGVTKAITFGYDGAGRQILGIDAGGGTNVMAYDALGRMTNFVDAAGAETTFLYDSRDNLVEIIDAEGASLRFEYDGNNRLVRRILPLGQAHSNTYNAAGQLVETLDPASRRRTFAYDPAGNLTNIAYYAAGEPGTPERSVDLAYNSLGYVTAWSDGTYAGSCSYDAAGNLVFESVDYGAFALTNTYVYGAGDLRHSTTGPDGETLDYAYDGAGQITEIRVPGLGAITFNAYQWLRPSRVTWPGGTTRALTRDGHLQPLAIEDRDAAGNALLDLAYVLDPRSNPVRIDTDGAARDYAYDALNRIVAVAQDGTPPETYGYDDVGNRTASSQWPGTWTNDPNRRLVTAGAMDLAYDESGNTIERRVSGVVTRYVYDAANRLVEVRDGTDALVARYAYDPFGRRLRKEAGGTVTYFFPTTDGLAGEFNAAGQPLKLYAHLPAAAGPVTTGPLFMKEAGQYHFFLNDHQGLPQALVDVNGATTWRASYDAFGAATVEPGSAVTQNLRYPGQYFDAESGLHYNLHRYYDPVTGRYLEPDPSYGMQAGNGTLMPYHWDRVKLLPPLHHAYVYANGNPQRWIDPLGLDAWVGFNINADVFAAVVGAAVFGGVVMNPETTETCVYAKFCFRYGIGGSLNGGPSIEINWGGPRCGEDLSGTASGVGGFAAYGGGGGVEIGDDGGGGIGAGPGVGGAIYRYTCRMWVLRCFGSPMDCLCRNVNYSLSHHLAKLYTDQ